MKRVILSINIILLCIISIAQVPESFNYQAIPRDNGAIYPEVTMYVKTSILSDSPSGSSVYTETFNPTTTSLGLLNLQIGKGTLVSGDFATIDWSSGSFYLKVEIDPTGVGTVYTDMGITQLLSVPYALYAKTGENVTGIVAIANGGTGATSVSGAKTSLSLGNVDNTTDLLKPISTSTQTALDLKAPLASPTFTGTPFAPTATPNTNTTQIATTAFVTTAIAASAPAHYIGEYYGGGIIFWLDASGQHGLVAATEDQSLGIQWYNGSNTTTGATLDGVYAGKANTNLIISQQGAGIYAAQVCNDYAATVNNEYYDDWYLPSKYELNLLYLQKAVVGSYASYYWSSTEDSNSNAWEHAFDIGSQNNPSKSYTDCVRAIRTF